MKKNSSPAEKKLYMFWVNIENYVFLARTAGRDCSMAIILNRLIENAREQDKDFIERLLKPPNPI